MCQTVYLLIDVFLPQRRKMAAVAISKWPVAIFHADQVPAPGVRPGLTIFQPQTRSDYFPAPDLV